MSFSDARFAYGPFAPYWVPRQYIENYFSVNKLESYLQLNTTVENLVRIPHSSVVGEDRWKLTLRKYDALRHVDIWWEEEFDAVIIANGHYAVPYVGDVFLVIVYLSQADVFLPILYQSASNKKLIDPPCSWARVLPPKVSRPRSAFQNLPGSYHLRVQESGRHR